MVHRTMGLPHKSEPKNSYCVIWDYAIHCWAFTINNGRTNVRQWLRQAYSPPPRYDAFSPNASHWAE